MISPEMFALITLGLLLVFLVSGVHIGTSLMATSLVGVFLITGRFEVAMNVLSQAAWATIRQYMFGVIPLFVLMGLLVNLSGVSQELYDAASVLLKRVRGGVGITTVVANALFSATTGVTIASAVVFTKIALPQMMRLKYNRKLALGTISSSAILGFLLPPSLLMIVYGSQADTSIGRLFIAGIIPGLILAVAIIAVILIIAWRRPTHVPEAEPLTDEERKNFWKIILKPWAIVVLIFCSLGGIWLGFFTPTEAGGVGAFGAFIIVIAKGKFTLRAMWETLLSTASSTGRVLILIIAASTYARALSMGGVINMAGRLVERLDPAPIVVILVFMVIILAVASVLDSTSTMLLTIPLMVPIVVDLGYDLVWFGIVMIVAVGSGLITPPFGMNVFTVKAATHGMKGAEDVTIEEIFMGSLPFFFAVLVVLLICIFFPAVVTFLPSLM